MSHWPVSLASCTLLGHISHCLGQTMGNQCLGPQGPAPVSQSWVGSICWLYEQIEGHKEWLVFWELFLVL